jgi:hypothetical protein
VIGDAAGRVDATSAGAGVTTLGAHTGLVQRAVGVEQALWPAAHRGIARVVAQTAADGLVAVDLAGRVRAARRRVAGVAWRWLGSDLGLLHTACEWVASVPWRAGADWIVILNAAACEHTAGTRTGVQALLS